VNDFDWWDAWKRMGAEVTVKILVGVGIMAAVSCVVVGLLAITGN